MRSAAPLLALAFAAGCGQSAPTVIDGSSELAFERSVAVARNDLPYADRLAFDEAIRTVDGRRYARRDPARLARATFNGMTAAEVVADQHSRQAGE